MNSREKLSAPVFYQSGGKTGKLIAETNWSKHPLGDINGWPNELNSTLKICLLSPVPMAIYWGREMYVFYNDAWDPIFDNRAKYILGRPAKNAWGKYWEMMEPLALKVFKSGKAAIHQKVGLPVVNNGFHVESYSDYVLNPVLGKDKKVLAVVYIAQDITRQVLADRRDRIYRRLYEKALSAESPDAACIHLANVLSETPHDVPFALFYLLNSDKSSLRLTATTSIDFDHALAKPAIDLAKDQSIFPYSRVIKNAKQHLVKNLDKKFYLPGGIWEENSRQAAILPIKHARSKEIYGVVILGVSPRLVYDSFYDDFFKQLSEQIAFAVGAAYDTRSKLTLEAREAEAQKQLQAALTSNLVGIWTWDLSENLVYADKNLSYQLGIEDLRPQDGVIPSVFLNSINPKDKSRIKKLIKSAVAKTKKFEAEYSFYNRNNQQRWVISRGKVETNQAGTATRFSGVTIDITDHKNMELKLASSEQRFKALFDSSIIAVSIVSMDGKIHEANHIFLKMFGYTKKDLSKDLNAANIIPAGREKVMSLIYKDLIKKGEVEPSEKEYLRKDGTIFPTLAGAVMIPGSNDRFIAFMLDISEQKQLVELNKAKDEFISIASHQLRTPATGIKQYLGMLLEGYAGKIPAAQKKIIKTAYYSNERQLKIANDLLRVAQADASEVKLKLSRVNLVDILTDVTRELAPKFEAKKQNLKITQRPAIIAGNFDPIYMRMVFENLIDNASKYTPDEKNINMQISSGSKNLIIKIKDEGIGIRKSDMPKLFKKFSRIDNPLSTSAGGTGLGLYWVKKIVELHGGTITATSEYKKGSQFVITLPLM